MLYVLKYPVGPDIIVKEGDSLKADQPLTLILT